ncbi:MAG: SurA N-terminal domain-containing protein [Pseudomonadota bacterium]|nr:SurA N-terminal domain-containing protein [Pseudomonadota bacterium]
MLGDFRKTIISWGAKVLLALLVVSFALWGIGDYTTGGGVGNESVAEVGDENITTKELDTEVRSSLNRMQKMFGQTITLGEARDAGMVDQTLNSLIDRKIFVAGALSSGLLIDDQLLGQTIRENKQFSGPSGNFSRSMFSNFLRQIGYNESSYADRLRAELLTKQLISSFASGIAPPDHLIYKFNLYRNELRTIRLLEIKHRWFKKIPEPSSNELTEFHKKYSSLFAAPEYRTVHLVRLEPKYFIDEVSVSEKRVREAYENSISDFRQEEKRELKQILVANKSEADDIKADLDKSGDYERYLSKTSAIRTKTANLGNLTQREIPIAKLGEVAFKLPKKAYSQPIKSDLGWHILYVSNITPASIKSFESVKQKIKKSIQLDLAADIIVPIANNLEDALGGGDSLSEAAAKLNLKLEKLEAVSKRGLDKTGKKIPGISENADIISVIFNTAKGEISPLTDYGEASSFILFIEDITSSHIKPLSLVRNAVSAAWKKRYQSQLANKKATEALSEIKKGKSIIDIAKQFKTTSVKLKPFKRNGEGLEAALPRDLVTKVFSLDTGNATLVEHSDSHLIAMLENVEAPNILDEKNVDIIKNQLANDISEDLAAQLGRALRESVGVVVNRNIVNQLYSSSNP